MRSKPLNLLLAVRNLGMHSYEAAQKIGMNVGEFSKALNGRREFTPAQKAQLERLTGRPGAVLFSPAPPESTKAGASLADLFKSLEDALAIGGDPVFVLERIYRAEPRAIYLHCCDHLLRIFRRRYQIRPDVHFHIAAYWEHGPYPQPFIFMPGPPRRPNEDTIQRAESALVHPVHESDWPPVRETAMLMPQGERR